MDFRLLVDADVIDFLQTLQAAERRRVYGHFRKIQQYPANCSDNDAEDSNGRHLDVSSFERFNIYFWTDAADRHIKILEVRTTK